MGTTTAGTARTGLIRSSLAAASAGTATGGLALGALTAIEQVGRGPLAVDAAVAAAVLSLGTVAGGLLTIGCLLLAAGAAVAGLGRSARRIEAAAALLTPAVLRRAVAVTVGTGLGLAAASGVATASEIDLGWAITTASTAAIDSEPDPADITTATIRPGPGSLAPPAHASSPANASSAAAVPAETAPPSAPPPAGPAAATDGAVPTGVTDTTDTTVPTGATGATDTTDTLSTTVIVAAGDSLWAIAARRLPGASDAAIAAAWPRWHDANRTVIGDDPDLIRPGQCLVVPAEYLSATPDEEQP